MAERMPADRLRIVLFTDMPPVAAAVPQLLNMLGHDLVGIVASRKRQPAVGNIVGVAPSTTDVIISEHPRRWAAFVAAMRPDVIISSSFPWRIPQATLEAPRFGAFNLHPSLLPKYRGTATPHWTLLNDERTTGITAHRMVAGFDAGPILAQAEIQIGPDDDVQTLVQAIFTRAPEVAVTALARLVAGDAGEPQDESQATYFGQLPESERQIDWSSPARRVHNQVRALAGFVDPPGAYATLDGSSVRLLRSRIVNAEGAVDVEPGTVIDRDDEGLTIQCGDGSIKVLAYEPA